MWYSLRKHSFLLALRRWGRQTTPAAKSEEKRMFSQAINPYLPKFSDPQNPETARAHSSNSYKNATP